LRYGPAFDDSITPVPLSAPNTPCGLDKIDEGMDGHEDTSASVRSGMTDGAKELALGDSRVALVGKP
jgi:hypothetical protein